MVMKKIAIVFSIIFLLNTSCYHRNLMIKRIDKVEVCKISHKLEVRSALNTVERFDSLDVEKELMDTIILNVDKFKLILGKKNSSSYIDSRTKVIITKKSGRKFVLLIDQFGEILYKGKIYSGNREQLFFLRGEKDEE